MGRERERLHYLWRYCAGLPDNMIQVEESACIILVEALAFLRMLVLLGSLLLAHHSFHHSKKRFSPLRKKPSLLVSI